MSLPQKDSAITSIQSFIRKWNIKYPLDKWYRNKFNIRYNSTEHCDTNIVDIRMMFEEDVMYREAFEQAVKEKSSKYIPGAGQWLKNQPKNEDMTQDQIVDLYQNIDIKDFVDDPDEITINLNE